MRQWAGESRGDRQVTLENDNGMDENVVCCDANTMGGTCREVNQLTAVDYKESLGLSTFGGCCTAYLLVAKYRKKRDRVRYSSCIIKARPVLVIQSLPIRL